MKDTELNWIRERCKNASAEPWLAIILDDEQYCVFAPDYPICTTLLEEDAHFIASARNDVPRLLDEIEQLKKEADLKEDFLNRVEERLHRMREALKFYADPKTYVDPYYIDSRSNGQPSILSEGGQCAREALGEK